MTRAPREVRAPGGRRARRRLFGLVSVAAVVQAFTIVGVLHARGDDLGHAHEAVYVDPVAHWLRDAVLYVPASVALLLLATLLARHLAGRWLRTPDGVGAAVLWAGLGAGAYALASVPAAMAHGALFTATGVGLPSLLAALQEAIVTLRYSFGLLVFCVMVLGLPWAPRRRRAPTPPARDADPDPVSPSSRSVSC